jgi:mRNA interferase RelE/StbE
MRLVVLPAARRELHKLTADVGARVAAAIEMLARHPRPHGCKLLQGRESRTWRIRVGDWRALCDVDDVAGVVTVLRVLHRSKAY